MDKIIKPEKNIRYLHDNHLKDFGNWWYFWIPVDNEKQSIYQISKIVKGKVIKEKIQIKDKIKYLGIHLTEEVKKLQWENYKTAEWYWRYK